MLSIAFPFKDRRAFLVVLGGLHLLVLFSFGPAKVMIDAPKETFITLVLAPAEREAVREQRRPAPAVPVRARARAAPQSSAMTVVDTSAGVEPPAELAPSSIPEPAPPMSMRERALGHAGDIDKELREKSFDLRERKKLAYEEPKFARDVAAAGKARGVVVEEIVAPDGRKITRINGKCYYAPPAGITIMHDPFKGGPPQIKRMSCPREK